MTIDGVLSLDKGRKRAKALLGQVANGIDPLAAKRQAAANQANSLQAIAEEYFTRE
jgi:hypothetical protein